jgi:tRNA pseudouridine55 synthase
VPSKVSAIKIDGKRSYRRVRDGEQVDLPARPVTVSAFTVHDVRPGTAEDGTPVTDVVVTVVCSSGTYVRALARDLGAALGVGGHLIALRRTRVGGFALAEAVTLEALAQRAPQVVTMSLAEAARSAFPHREATAEQARVLSHGGRLPAAGIAGPYAVFAPDGDVVAIVTERQGQARPEIVLSPG